MDRGRPHNDLRATAWLLHAAGLGVTLALCAAGWLCVLGPITTQTDDARQRLDAARSLLKSDAAVRRRNVSLHAQHDGLESQSRQLLSRMPETPEESEFLAQLTQLAVRTGVLLREFQPSAAAANDSFQELEIRVSAESDYESLCRFLAGVNDLPRLCRLTALDLAVADDPGGPYRVEMGIVIFCAP
ncbi:MAG: type 4a pilus biogenesis protein PilO [Planctomycetaceae bacterium]